MIELRPFCLMDVSQWLHNVQPKRHKRCMCKLVTGFFELPPSDSTLVFHSMRWPQLGHVT